MSDAARTITGQSVNVDGGGLCELDRKVGIEATDNIEDSLTTEVRARIEEACQRGATSIHSTGASPGFSTGTLPFIEKAHHYGGTTATSGGFAQVLDNNDQRNAPQLHRLRRRSRFPRNVLTESVIAPYGYSLPNR